MARQLEQMIAEQVRKWSLSQSLTDRRGGPRGIWPVITVSREFGARGAALAAVLGQRIGFKVWDKDLLQAIAAEAGGAEAVLQSLDEHRRKAIDDAISGVLMGSPHTNAQYLRALMRVVRTIAAHGKGIIVGRGANYIGRPDAMLRVRVVCPLDQRVRDYARRQHLDEHEARLKIARMDADRADFVRFHFKRDVSEPSDYDLVLNSGTYDLHAMADVVLAAYEAKMGRRPPEES